MNLQRPFPLYRSLLAGDQDFRKRTKLSRASHRLQAGSDKFVSVVGRGLPTPPCLRSPATVRGGVGRPRPTSIRCGAGSARSSRAFTLIEVLISLAILGLAAIVLGAAYSNTLEAHRAIAARAVAGAPVDFLREAVLNEPERDKVEKGGDVQLPDNRRLRWEAKIEEALVPDLFQVVITGRVEGEPNRPPQDFTQKLMLLRPTWSDASRREQLRSEWRASRPKEGEK